MSYVKRSLVNLLGRKVRFKGASRECVGVVVGRYSLRGWWRVEWPNGSKKLYPTRDLEIVK